MDMELALKSKSINIDSSSSYLSYSKDKGKSSTMRKYLLLVMFGVCCLAVGAVASFFTQKELISNNNNCNESNSSIPIEAAQPGKMILSSMYLIAPSSYSFGSTVGADGSVYFTEFNAMRVQKVNPDGNLETLLRNQPGLYSVVAGPQNQLYFGLDLGDNADPVTGKFPGKIARLNLSERNPFPITVVDNIRRPRQMTFDEKGTLLVVLEADRRIIYCTPLSNEVSCSSPRIAVQTDPRYPPNGLAFWNGMVYWSEYGEFVNRDDILFGRIKKAPFPNGFEETVIANLTGRGRGIASDRYGNIYFVTESNAEDHGNSAFLGMIRNGQKNFTVLVDGLDYPQFISISPKDGSVIIPMAREPFIARYIPNAKTFNLGKRNPGLTAHGNEIKIPFSSVSIPYKNVRLNFTQLGRIIRS
jgi:hypothetical protein